MARTRRRWLLRTLLTIFILVIGLGFLVTSYVEPEQPIEWSHPSNDSIRSIMERVIKERSREVVITEQEWNQYATAQVQQLLLQHQEWSQWNVQGMYVKLLDGQLDIALHVRPWDLIDVELHIYTDVKWSKANQKITLTPSRIQVKDIPLPTSWFSMRPVSLDLAPYLPSLVRIDDVRAEAGQWTIRFGLQR